MDHPLDATVRSMDGQPWKELGSNRRSRPPRPGGISLANPRSSPSSNAGAKTPHGQEHRLTPSRDSSPLWAYKDRFLREFDPQANLAVYRQSTKPSRYRRQCSTAPPFWSHDASTRTNFRYQAAQFVGRSGGRSRASTYRPRTSDAASALMSLWVTSNGRRR